MEGKETRFGVPNSALFAAATTLTSTGAVDSFHDSYTASAGGMLLLNMMLGEVAPGGTGSGLYGMLILAVIAVFIAGLMVGRTPEYLGKKIGAREIKFASLLHPDHAGAGAGRHRAGDGAARQSGSAMLNTGAARLLRGALRVHLGRQQQRLARSPASRSNTAWYNTALGLCMLLGRFLPMVFVLALAGSLARQQPVPGVRGHPAHPPAAVRRPAGRRHR